MVINNRPVSDNILRIISERGYKQSAVARKAGYSRQTFGTWCIILELFARKTSNASLLPWELNRVSCSRMLT